MIKELTIEEIVKRKMHHAKVGAFYKDEELHKYKIGVIRAYNEMLPDINQMNESELQDKYIDIVLKLEPVFEQYADHGIGDGNEIEIMAGYNNTIIDVIGLINPFLEGMTEYFVYQNGSGRKTPVKEVTLYEIIKRKIQYLNENEEYQSEEIQEYKQSSIETYYEIIKDSESMNEQALLEKYVALYKKYITIVHNDIKYGHGDQVACEKLEGYTDSIYQVISRIVPGYEDEF